MEIMLDFFRTIGTSRTCQRRRFTRQSPLHWIRRQLPSPFPPALVGGLQRQADCSLTYFDFSYESNSASVRVNPNSQIEHFEKTLHDNALLKSAGDQFLTGCVDSARESLPGHSFSLEQRTEVRMSPYPGTSGVITSGLKSDGTFTLPAMQATPVTPISLVTADLNQDGNADLISINSDGVHSSVTVFLRKGDGTYENGISYALPGARAQYGVLDDLNGDGVPDLLVSSDSPSFAFSVFIGNGDGTFQPAHTFAPANATVNSNDAFLTADVNGDGFKDIVTAQGQIFLERGMAFRIRNCLIRLSRPFSRPRIASLPRSSRRISIRMESWTSPPTMA